MNQKRRKEMTGHLKNGSFKSHNIQKRNDWSLCDTISSFSDSRLPAVIFPVSINHFHLSLFTSMLWENFITFNKLSITR